MNPKLEKLKKILSKSLGLNDVVFLAKEIVELDDKIDVVKDSVLSNEKSQETVKAEINKKIEDLSDFVKENKINESFIIDSIKESIIISPVENGKDYILTESDKKEIASKIEPKVITKVIERTEIVKEQPIITNEIVKEITKDIEPNDLVIKINSLSEDDEKIDASHIKGLPEFKGKDGRYMNRPGIVEAPRDGKQYARKNRDWVEIQSNGLGDSFETISKNLKSYPYAFNKTGNVLDSITYTLPTGTIVKTFNRTGIILNSIVLSGDTPSGVDLTKTYNRVGEVLTDITYS